MAQTAKASKTCYRVYHVHKAHAAFAKSIEENGAFCKLKLIGHSPLACLAGSRVTCGRSNIPNTHTSLDRSVVLALLFW